MPLHQVCGVAVVPVLQPDVHLHSNVTECCRKLSDNITELLINMGLALLDYKSPLSLSGFTQ